MAKLNNKEIVMVGGLTIPKAGNLPHVQPLLTQQIQHCGNLTWRLRLGLSAMIVNSQEGLDKINIIGGYT